MVVIDDITSFVETDFEATNVVVVVDGVRRVFVSINFVVAVIDIVVGLEVVSAVVVVDIVVVGAIVVVVVVVVVVRRQPALYISLS
jgi:hypothetical protein